MATPPDAPRLTSEQREAIKQIWRGLRELGSSTGTYVQCALVSLLGKEWWDVVLPGLDHALPEINKRMAELHAAELARYAQHERARAIDNVIGVLDEYIAAGVDVDYTMQALVERVDWGAIAPSAVKAGLRLMLETTTELELRDISNQADNERAILRSTAGEPRASAA